MNSTYSIHVYPFPETVSQPLFERFLFNETSHLKTQAQPGDQVLTFLLEGDGFTHARLVIFVVNDKGMSPRRATFGGIESYPEIPSETLLFFIQGVLDHLKKQGLTRLLIRSLPDGLNPELAALLHRTYLQAGFTVITTELNQHLPVNEPSIDHLLHNSTHRRLKKSLREGLHFEEWLNPDWAIVHAFITAARERKQRPMTMSLETLFASVTQLPNVFQVFTARFQGKLAALVVTVRINERILYTLYPADAAEFLDLSPLILVNAGLYQYCLTNQYQILDLGISTENGVRNEGLIRFKKNLGAITSEKHSYQFLFE